MYIVPRVPSELTWQGLGQGLVEAERGLQGLLTACCPLYMQFAEKFQEVKEAARLAREKSQDGGEFTSPALGLLSHQVSTLMSGTPG